MKKKIFHEKICKPVEEKLLARKVSERVDEEYGGSIHNKQFSVK